MAARPRRRRLAERRAPLDRLPAPQHRICGLCNSLAACRTYRVEVRGQALPMPLCWPCRVDLREEPQWGIVLVDPAPVGAS